MPSNSGPNSTQHVQLPACLIAGYIESGHVILRTEAISARYTTPLLSTATDVSLGVATLVASTPLPNEEVAEPDPAIA